MEYGVVGYQFDFSNNNIVILFPVLQESLFINEIKFSANKYKFSLYIMNNKVKKKLEEMEDILTRYILFVNRIENRGREKWNTLLEGMNLISQI